MEEEKRCMEAERWIAKETVFSSIKRSIWRICIMQ